jgi:hypothetical protein
MDFCLTTMVMDPMVEMDADRMPRHDYSMLFAILDEHIKECEKRGKKEDREEIGRLDEVLYALYSDLSALHQTLSLLRFRRPHAPRRDLNDVRATESRRGWRYLNKDFLDRCRWQKVPVSPESKSKDAHMAVSTEEISNRIKAEQHLVRLLTDFLESLPPKGPRNTKAWLEDFDAQRAALSRFWEAMRQRHKSTLLRLGFQEADIILDLKALSADTSPEHIQAINAQRDEVLNEITRKEAEKASKLQKGRGAPSDVQTQWGVDEQSTPTANLSRLKTKTRGDIAQKELMEDDNSAASTMPEEVLKVAVTKRAFSVFKAMFPGREVEDRSKNVDWDQFVGALGEGEVGFVARQSAGGAAYSFEPNETSRWFGRGKIVFHKPHPETYFDPVQMAINGKRMTKWFGWSENTFELKK